MQIGHAEHPQTRFAPNPFLQQRSILVCIKLERSLNAASRHWQPHRIIPSTGDDPVLKPARHFIPIVTTKQLLHHFIPSSVKKKNKPNLSNFQHKVIYSQFIPFASKPAASFSCNSSVSLSVLIPLTYFLQSNHSPSHSLRLACLNKLNSHNLPS